ncbi:MAG: M13 family metallopeptidase, partial [Thermoanaerobaculia bacterium]
AIGDRNALLSELTRLHSQGLSPAFRMFAQNDFKNSKMMIGAVGAGSVGLPDRDYYLRDDERFKTIRGQYVDHIAKMFALTGEDATMAKFDAGRVFEIETKLAQAMLPRVEMRKPENVYHMTTMEALQQLAPAIDWVSYLGKLGVDQPSVNVTQPKYLQTVSQMFADVPLEDWKTYLRWTVIDAAAPTLTRALVDEDFDFNSRILSGQQAQLERWKRCVRAADSNIGQLVGQEYVRRRFTPEAKRKMSELIDNLIAALREDIPTLTWMGPQTKQAALAKLNAFQRRIGYPEKWTDYSMLSMSRDSYAQNAAAAKQFNFARNMRRVGNPDDPNEWGFFTPATVNAGYSPSLNNITFPAGILQPPFYDPNAEDGYNYGGIGTVIGHEMTHGFDDQGAKFDPEGNLRNWWTAEDLANFDTRTSCVANEYSEFNVAQNININGKLVLGEAVADLGGATIALAAYEKSLQGKPRKVIDGFTPEQRFFLGFAQVWGENMAVQEQTRRALTDPHAQGPFRVNGTVANMPAFQKAFGCKENAKMVREASKRCAIW